MKNFQTRLIDKDEMELDDLKSVWNAYSSQNSEKHHLENDSLTQMMKNKTKSLVERIDRNIRIGMGLLFLYIAILIVNDYFFSQFKLGQLVEYPLWLKFIDVFTNSLIVFTYLYFIIRYYKIKRNFSSDNQLKTFLQGIILTILTYRRMFYLATIILMINMTVGFITGFYEGIKLNASQANLSVEDFIASKLFLMIGVGVAILIPLIVLSFLLLRWGFNKLYGHYLHYLNKTLQELDETNP